MRGNSSAVRKSAGKQQLSLKRPKAVIKLRNLPKAKVVLFPMSRAAKPKKRVLSAIQRENVILETRIQARRMARSLLRRWRSRLDVFEVDSVVDLSLCEAASRFDPTRGVSFITFLFYHLRGNMIRLVVDSAQNNNITLIDAENFDTELEKNCHNQFCNSSEIAAALNSQEQVLPDEQLYRKQLSSISKQACESLDELEKEVISRVFIHEDNVYDLAKALGYSRCHISRIKKKALISLKQELAPVLFAKHPNIGVRLIPRRRPVSRRGTRCRDLKRKAIDQEQGISRCA